MQFRYIKIIIVIKERILEYICDFFKNLLLYMDIYIYYESYFNYYNEVILMFIIYFLILNGILFLNIQIILFFCFMFFVICFEDLVIK